ncbi:MAG: transposase [bacterium]|nr:transposase [bacterium]
MPRSPRIIEADEIYHVLNRSNAKVRIFETDKDYLAFEKVLFEAKEKYPIRILSYCIMPNHWHFVMQSEKDNDLPTFMRWLTQTHTQRWLAYREMIGCGHLYQGRYKSFPIQKDEHLLQVCRYVERNALRSKLVNKAEDWRWGSAWVRVSGSSKQKKILSPWPTPKPIEYLDWLNTNQPHEEDQLENVRKSVNRGQPFGLLSWIENTAEKLDLIPTLRPKGRPRTRDKKGSDPF